MNTRSSSLLVFFSGCALMMTELIAIRFVAPYIGVSIFTWTSVIGIMLMGMSMGSYAGGVWADHVLSRSRLGLCCIASGISILFMSLFVPVLGTWFDASSFALWERALLLALVCFLSPAFFLATIPPQVIRLMMMELTHAGVLIGRIGAWQALGSIAGTVLAGFVLIPLLGTQRILIVIALSLLMVGSVVSNERRMWKTPWTVVVLLLVLATILTPRYCQRETNYYCLRVSEDVREGSRRYLLRLDHLVHSYVDPEHPRRVGYDYEQLYRRILAVRSKAGTSTSSFFIGGGGYTLPRYLEAQDSSARIVVAEIDPGVTRANHDFMKLSSTTTIRSVNEDARTFLRRGEDHASFDFVFGDAFNDFSVPYHLTTIEFHRELKTHMTADGIYALNIIDDVRYGKFLAAMIRTLKPVWRHVYVAPLRDALKPGRNTYVLIASDTPLDRSAWDGAQIPAPEEGIAPSVFHLLTDEEVEHYLSVHPVLALRDDFVPIDRYLAPVFHDAY